MLPHNSYASPGPLRSRAWIPSSLSTDKMKDGCRSRGICLAMAVGLWVAKLGGSLTKCDHIIYVYILYIYIYVYIDHICICACAYICVYINILYIYIYVCVCVCVICPLHNCICMIIHVPTQEFGLQKGC